MAGRVARLAASPMATLGTTMRLLLAFLALCVCVCPASSQEVRPASSALFQKAISDGRFADAVAIAEEVIARSVASEQDGLARLPREVIVARADQRNQIISLAALEAYQPGGRDTAVLDARVREHYEAALREYGVRSNGRRSVLAMSVGKYFVATSRPGLAQGYASQAIRFADAEGNGVAAVSALGGLAGVYRAAGQTHAARALLDLTLERAATLTGDASVMPATVATAQLVLASDEGDSKEALRLWNTLKAAPQEGRLGLMIASIAASALALAGENAAAEEALDRLRTSVAEQMATPGVTDSMRGFMAATVQCLEAQALSVRDPAAGLAALKPCEGQLVLAESNTFRIFIAQAQERVGEDAAASATYARAISTAETARSSLDSDMRTQFFAGPWRTPYIGATRVAAKMAATAPESPGTFFAAVAAAERYRARQLGERTGAALAPDATNIARWAATLGDGDVVLAISDLQSTQLVHAFTRDQRRVHNANLSRVALEPRVRGLHARLGRPDSDTAALEADLQTLSATLLGPLRPMLANARRIIVLVDGPLSLIPMGLLSADTARYVPLSPAVAIQYAPSLRLLTEPARPRANRRGGLFAVGDPVFPPAPEVVGLSQQQAMSLAPSGGVTRAASGMLAIPPLPETRREVEAISLALRGAPATRLFGAEASEAGVKRADLSRFRIVHFATHGLLASDLPGLLEPSLVLAAGDGEDGFLQASEVSALKLDADLAVLSACNTASGRIVAGEGVMGLSRAFLVAGSRSVVASLWPVDSLATERFMKVFYQRLSTGETPSRALQGAMVDIRATQPNPMYWAPFILIGRTLDT